MNPFDINDWPFWILMGLWIVSSAGIITFSKETPEEEPQNEAEIEAMLADIAEAGRDTMVQTPVEVSEQPKVIVKPDAGEEDETYGHPFAPLKVLRERLPKLGPNHLWESWVDLEHGYPLLWLRLIEVNPHGPDKEVADAKICLYFEGVPEGYELWSRFYRSTRILDRLSPEQAKDFLLGNLLDWAAIHANRTRTGPHGYGVQQ